jgi:hypothetical protein
MAGPARHREETFVRGDTWIIRGSLFDTKRVPLPIPDGSIIEWALLDDERSIIARCDLTSGIQVIDSTNGLILITVPSAVTADVAPGDHYTDALRATFAPNFNVATMWIGSINIDDSPFLEPLVMSP